MLNCICFQNTLDIDRTICDFQRFYSDMRDTDPSQIFDILLIQVVCKSHSSPFILYTSMMRINHPGLDLIGTVFYSGNYKMECSLFVVKVSVIFIDLNFVFIHGKIIIFRMPVVVTDDGITVPCICRDNGILT